MKKVYLMAGIIGAAIALAGCEIPLSLTQANYDDYCKPAASPAVSAKYKAPYSGGYGFNCPPKATLAAR